jgi:uncharacterized protein
MAACPDPSRQKAADSPIKSALTLYFLFLATILITNLILVIAGVSRSDPGWLTAESVTELIATGIVLAWCSVSWPDVRPLLMHSPGAGWYCLAAGLALITLPVASVVVKFLVHWLNASEIHYLEPFTRNGRGWTAAILMICVQPAIIEELAFRGLILGSLRRVLSDWEAIGVSATLFAIIHLSILSSPHLFLLGLVLGYLRIRTRSLYPGMLLHFTHNLLVLLTEAWETQGI